MVEHRAESGPDVMIEVNQWDLPYSDSIMSLDSAPEFAGSCALVWMNSRIGEAWGFDCESSEW